MNKLKDFMNILTGSFNNSEQFDKMKLDNIDFPYAEHVNTICNDKIINLPEDFKGIFMVEESYYTSNGNTHASPHLFLFTQEENGIKLTSYEVKGTNLSVPYTENNPTTVKEVKANITVADTATVSVLNGETELEDSYTKKGQTIFHLDGEAESALFLHHDDTGSCLQVQSAL